MDAPAAGRSIRGPFERRRRAADLTPRPGELAPMNSVPIASRSGWFCFSVIVVWMDSELEFIVDEIFDDGNVNGLMSINDGVFIYFNV